MNNYITYDVIQLEEMVEDEMSLGVVFGEQLSIDGVTQDVVSVNSYPYSDVVSPDSVYFHTDLEQLFMYYTDFIIYLGEVNHVKFSGNYKLNMERSLVSSISFELLS